jgi:hypothetical protein
LATETALGQDRAEGALGYWRTADIAEADEQNFRFW